MTDPDILVHPDANELAAAVASRLAARLREAQAAHGDAGLVLTGGRIAEKIYAALAGSAARDTVDWARVDMWWGDERFLPPGDPERNETQARAALLDALPLTPERVHPMPATGGPAGDDPDAAAAWYAAELAAAAGPGGSELPRFDVVLLGIGEDGHVASVFPDHPVSDDAGVVAGVRDSPKPPPMRVTLTLPTLNRADEVWIIASGDGKAEAVGKALAGTVPAGRVRGIGRTLWLLDRAAAAALPADPDR